MAALLSKGALPLFALTAFAFAPSATATGPVAASAYSDIEVENNERKLLGLRGQEQNVKDSIEVDSARRRLGFGVDCAPNQKPLKFSKHPIVESLPDVYIHVYDGCKDEREENTLFYGTVPAMGGLELCVSEEGYYVIKAYRSSEDHQGRLSILQGRHAAIFDGGERGGGVGILLELGGEFVSEVGSKSSCPIVSRYYCADTDKDPGDDKICMFGNEDEASVCRGCSPDNEECRKSKCQGREPY